MENVLKILLLVALFVIVPRWMWGQDTKVKIALLKYKGGGDWYANPTSLPNLIRFCNKNLQTNLAAEPVTVEPGNRDIFNYPFVHMTGARECRFYSGGSAEPAGISVGWRLFACGRQLRTGPGFPEGDEKDIPGGRTRRTPLGSSDFQSEIQIPGRAS